MFGMVSLIATNLRSTRILSTCITTALLLKCSCHTTGKTSCHIGCWTKRWKHRSHSHGCCCGLHLRCIMLVVMVSASIHTHCTSSSCKTQVVVVSIVTLHTLKMMHLALLFMLLLCVVLARMVLLIILLLLYSCRLRCWSRSCRNMRTSCKMP